MDRQQLESRIDDAYRAYVNEKNVCTVKQLNSLQMQHQELYKTWYFPAELAQDNIYREGVPEPAYDGLEVSPNYD